eukprot:CAMPEP_0174266998 /NCGR_PEP_ID=MMETSP0439-20130205/32114_1 /TAXON_ID=0 /ORGANISM="Stereomyxa ramosa, Strain Chinc5" /LENGTH=398 /DNA_ID=CAMNT_0015354281 /DNA_START=186 /DNA_END=1382 /DNA_ORIENTATION=+
MEQENNNKLPGRVNCRTNQFALKTYNERLPRILRDVRKDLEDEEEQGVVDRILADLKAEAKPKPLSSAHPEHEAWNKTFCAYGSLKAMSFLHIETYLYARLCDELFFQRNKKDFFHPQKMQSLLSARPAIDQLLAGYFQENHHHPTTLPDLVTGMLWGNSHDLSLFSHEKVKSNDEARSGSAKNSEVLLVDDTEAFVEFLEKHEGLEVGVICDNFGLELFSDLLFAHRLVQTKNARFVLHVKAAPVFVSDTMAADVPHLFDVLGQTPHRERFVGELKEMMASSQVRFEEDLYWNAPYEWHEGMPQGLVDTLRRHDVVVVKGDANYRKLVREREWPLDTPLQDAIGYFPSLRVAVLRLLKCETAVGLDSSRLPQEDDWMVKGKYGVIHWAVRPEQSTNL